MTVVSTTRRREAVAPKASGLVYTIARQLGGTSLLALGVGTHANLALAGTSIVAASAIPDGTEQTAVVYEETSFEGVKYAVTIAAGTVAIVTPPPLVPVLTFTNPIDAVAEGNTGTKVVSNTLNVVRNGVTGPLDVLVSYGGTAANNDYVAGPTSLLIPANGNSISFDLTIYGDTDIEPDETIIMAASLTLYPATPTVRSLLIVNDDATIPVLIASPANPKITTATPENTAISLITGAVAGGVASLSPNDGRVKFDGDATNGYVIRKGAAAISVGTLKATFSVTGQQSIEISIENSQASNTITPIMNPIGGTLGGSKMRQSVFVSGGETSGLPVSSDSYRPNIMGSWGSIGYPMTIMEPRLGTAMWAEETRSPGIARAANGLFFAADGGTFNFMLAMLPRLLASDINIVAVDTTNNSWGSITNSNNFAAYTKQLFDICNILIAAGKIVIIQGPIPKGTGGGGPFADYPGSPRYAIQGVIAAIKDYVAANATKVGFFDGFALLNDQVTPYNGILGYFREDYANKEIHLSGRGNHRILREAGLAEIRKFIHPDSTPHTRRISGAPNLLANADFASTEAISTSRITGVKPVGYALDMLPAATSSATTWTTSIVDVAVASGTRKAIRIQATGMDNMPSTTDIEGIVITLPNVALEKNSYPRFQAWTKFNTDYDGWKTWGLVYYNDAAGSNVYGNMGDSSDALASGAAKYPVPWKAGDTIRPYTPEHRTRAVGNTTKVTMTFSVSKPTTAGQVVDFLVYLPDFFNQTDPKLLVFNEADTRAPAITSPATFNMLETAIVPAQITANKPMFWSVDGGAAIDSYGKLTPPADVGSYSYTVTGTPIDIRDPLVPQAITVNVNADPNVFTDKFNYAADGPLNSDWTLLEPNGGTSGLLTSGGALGQSSSAGNGYNMGRAPQRGDTYQQRVTYSRLTSASSSFPRIYVCFEGVDGNNGIYARHTAASTMGLTMIVNGTTTALPSVTTDGTIAARFAIRVTGPRELKVWQGGAQLATVALPSGAPDIPATWKYSGVKVGGASIAKAIDDWQNAAAAIPFKDDLIRALPVTVAELTQTVSLSSGRGYASDFVGRTEGSDWNLLSVVRTDVSGAPTGTWNPDGSTLRASQFDGIAAGTTAVFRVTVDESKADFANRSTLNLPNTRTSIIDVTINFTA